MAILLIAVILFSGCAPLTATTKASYTPGGAITYESGKEQVGLDVSYEVDAKGQVKHISIRVDKSGTPEAAIAAALQQNAQMLKLLEMLLKSGAKVQQ